MGLWHWNPPVLFMEKPPLYLRYLAPFLPEISVFDHLFEVVRRKCWRQSAVSAGQVRQSTGIEYDFAINQYPMERRDKRDAPHYWKRKNRCSFVTSWGLEESQVESFMIAFTNIVAPLCSIIYEYFSNILLPENSSHKLHELPVFCTSF